VTFPSVTTEAFFFFFSSSWTPGQAGDQRAGREDVRAWRSGPGVCLFFHFFFFFPPPLPPFPSVRRPEDLVRKSVEQKKPGRVAQVPPRSPFFLTTILFLPPSPLGPFPRGTGAIRPFGHKRRGGRGEQLGGLNFRGLFFLPFSPCPRR